VSWCEQNAIKDVCPASELHIAMYLTHVFETKRKRGPLSDAINAINWAHDLAGLSTPTKSHFVKKVLEGTKRLCNKVSNQKDPLEVEDILELVTSSDLTQVGDLRFLLILTLAFAGLLRISELLALRVNDVVLFSDYAKFHIRKAKCDQLRDGEHVYIARSGLPSCPVALLEKYMAATTACNRQDSFLIGRLLPTKGKCAFKISGQTPLSYTRCREIILEGLKPLMKKFPEKNFGTHSMRIGGTSAAAAGGADKRILSKHGRWLSGKSRNRYIKDTVANRLSVTKCMQL